MDTIYERIIRTARENKAAGVIEEPRIFFEEIELPADGTEGYGVSDAFKNGEQYPVKIHWMTAALRYLSGGDEPEPVVLETLIQQVGLRFSFHGQDYMRREYVRLPLWHNRPTAAPDLVTFGQTTMRPELPWILSSRDTLHVRLQLDAANAETGRYVSFGVTGFGLDTKRPYFKSAERFIDDTRIHTLDTAQFRNDGDEPILITECAAHASAIAGSQDPQGDIWPLRVGVRQIGNGTNGDWVVSPSTMPSLCPAVNWGTQAGRCVVHQWPPNAVGGPGSPGLFWEPGEGIQVSARGPARGEDPPLVLVVALIGSIVVA